MGLFEQVNDILNKSFSVNKGIDMSDKQLVEVTDKNGNNVKRWKNIESDETYVTKRNLYDWAKKNLQGKKVPNENTGKVIEISSAGLGEWFKKSKSLEQILSIKYLESIIAKAKYTHSSENKHNEADFPFDYYESPISINGKDFNAILSIKSVTEGKNENQTTRKIYHHHYLDDIKIEPTSSLLRVDKATTALLLVDPCNSNIPQILKKSIFRTKLVVKKNFADSIRSI